MFLLASYNQYYVAAKKQTYESLPEYDAPEDTSEDGTYNIGLQAFRKFTPSTSPASTQTCKDFFGQADTERYAFQKQDCSSCSFIYETARSAEAALKEGEKFTMQFDLYAAMKLCPLAGYTVAAEENWRDNWFVVHLILIILSLFVVCSICLCWAFSDCAKGSVDELPVNDWDIREKQLRGTAKASFSAQGSRRDLHPVFSTHKYGSNKKSIEEAPISQRGLISKRNTEYGITKGGDFTDIRAVGGETKIVAMHLHAQAPQRAADYEEKIDVNVQGGLNVSGQQRVGYQSRQGGQFVQSTFETPGAPAANVSIQKSGNMQMNVSGIKRVDSVPKQMGLETQVI